VKRLVPAALVVIAIAGLLLPAGRASFAQEPGASSPFSPALIPTLTPEQALILQDAVRRGELTAEARAIVRANPAVEPYLPAAWREELRAEARPFEAGIDNALGRAIEERRARERAEEALIEARPPRPPYDWKRSVYVSRLFLSRLSREESEALVHFGHALFDPRREPGIGAEAYPVPEDYVVGPGDEVVVRLWGRVEGTHRMLVDREGKIFFPKMGPMHVAGKTYAELQAFLRRKTGAIAEARADVSLGQVKGFLVSVVGEVRVPGRFHVSSFHTVLQAIERAEGIRDIGSFRRVTLKRGPDAGREIDVYDFLLRGEVGRDVLLRSGDAVFVPVAGPLVAVAGEVRRQAIYELKEEKTVGDVLAMAGGLSPSAYGRRLQVERLEGRLSRVVLDLALEDAMGPLPPLELKDGDILRVLAILPEEENVVRVEGSVHRPGKYEWKPGLTVGSLIPDETFFRRDTFFDYALITRLAGPERRREAVPVDLRRIVLERDPAADVPLEPGDTLMVYNKDAFRERPRATVGGEVRRPGEYEILPNMRVSDLVKTGGDLTPNASPEEAELSRREPEGTVSLVRIRLADALAGVESEDLPVRDGDILMVRPIPDLQEARYITLSGEVRSPGIYAARKGERLSSILRRAGGFTEGANLRGAVFTRVSVQRRQQEVIDGTILQLEQEVARIAAREGAAAFDAEDVEAQKQILEARRALLATLRKVRAQGRIIVRLRPAEALEGTGDDLLIEQGDALEVPRAAEVVNVVGRVYNATAVVYDSKNRKAGHYLNKVGGPTEDADRDNIFVVRADGSVATSATIREGLWFAGRTALLEASLEPGDTIVVPEKLAYPRLMKEVKDITQILYQIAVAAGVLIVVF
jgi:protein involved in polysaccharide export with SLBB domain